MHILTFSASPRKLWLDTRRILNPSYWLLAALMAELANEETVFVIPESMTPVGRMRPYNGEHVDKIIIMGCAYSPDSMGASFNKDNPRHERVFQIADVARRAYERFRPEVINLAVDVRTWFAEATETFGFTPDRTISEQEMGWAAVGYNYAHRLTQNNRLPRRNQFAFCGGAKNRHAKMKDYVQHLPVPAVVDGGGWDSHVDFDHVTLRGFRQYHESVRLMLGSRYSLTLHEPLGEQHGWITARWYENLATGLINFTDSDFDKHEMVLPHGHTLRVSSGEDLRDKIMSRSYDDWLAIQRELIRPEWSRWETFYGPFRERLTEITGSV